MSSHVISACFVCLAFSLPASADSATLKQILANPSLLKDNCELIDAQEGSFAGKTYRVDSFKFPKNLIWDIVRIQFQGKETLLPFEKHPGFPFSPGYGPQAGYAPDPVLLVNNGNGGNGWNANQYYVVSLSDKTPAKIIGMTSGYQKEGNDDRLSLVVTDNIWEVIIGNMDILNHAEAPGAGIYLKVKNGLLIKDLIKTSAIARQRIEQLDAAITNLEPKVVEAIPKMKESGIAMSQSHELLSAMLARFLEYRAMDQQDKGMKILEKDLRFHSPDCFPVWHTVLNTEGKAVAADMIPVCELETQIKQSLEKRLMGPWLKQITSINFNEYN